jgi:uncharacterized protein (DUF4415 family)
MIGSRDGGEDDGNRRSNGKIAVSLTLDAETLRRLRELGPEWKEHVNRILREALNGDDEPGDS